MRIRLPKPTVYTKLTDNPDIPVLMKWISLTEAAEILAMSRQYVNKKAAEGDYKSLHRVGNSPSFVVQREEIEKIKKLRNTPAEIPVETVAPVVEEPKGKLKFSDL